MTLFWQLFIGISLGISAWFLSPVSVQAVACPPIADPIIPAASKDRTILSTTLQKDVTFSWNPPSSGSAVKYLFRMDKANPSWQGCITKGPGDICNDNVSGTSLTLPLTQGFSYDWWVQAVNSCGSVSGAQHGIVRVNNCGTAQNPTNLSPTGVLTVTTPQNRTFSWYGVPNATRYAFRLDRDPGTGTSSTWSNNCAQLNPGDVCGESTAPSFTAQIEPGHTYRYWIHALNQCGTWSSGAEARFTTAASPATPTHITPVGPQCYAIDIIANSERSIEINMDKTGETGPASIQVVGTAQTPDIRSITFKFFNRENGDQPIMYEPNLKYEKVVTNIQTNGLGRKFATIPLTYTELYRPDKNYLNNVVRNITVKVVFTDSLGRTSNMNDICMTDQVDQNNVHIVLKEDTSPSIPPNPTNPGCYSLDIANGSDVIYEITLGPIGSNIAGKIKILAYGTISTITKAQLVFFNAENQNKPVIYTGTTPYSLTYTGSQLLSDSAGRKGIEIPIVYDSLYKIDRNFLNNQGQGQYPHKIDVGVIFTDAAGRVSDVNAACTNGEKGNTRVRLNLLDPITSPEISYTPTPTPIAGICTTVDQEIFVKNPQEGLKLVVKYRLKNNNTNVTFKEIPMTASQEIYSIPDLPFPCSKPSKPSDGDVMWVEIRETSTNRWIARLSRRYMCATVPESCKATYDIDLAVKTPTDCACTSDVCSASCQFRTIQDTRISYTTPPSCARDAKFGTYTQAQSNIWCTRVDRTRGDADGDGRARWKDYYWYRKMLRSTSTIPPHINADFNGDGKVTDADELIILKELGKVF